MVIGGTTSSTCTCARDRPSRSEPLGATTGIFFFIGLGMFLLPPVPGVPVYFTGGVILVKSAEPVMGFGAALGFTIGICFLIKLCAIAIQQKAIGEGCGANSVWVRNVVGVNSLSIRAIKLILERPGLNLSHLRCLYCAQRRLQVRV